MTSGFEPFQGFRHLLDCDVPGGHLLTGVVRRA
jgi:hypothetical protein